MATEPEVNESPEQLEHYERAIQAVEQTLEKLSKCAPDEREKLQTEFAQLKGMSEKLRKGQVEIVVFGEISTGKSALINALIGASVAQVDVQGGWTKEIWQLPWDGAGYRLPGLGESGLVLVDTPGLNEVGGADRGDMAIEAARRADLILFVTDSDLNEIEHAALCSILKVHKPVIVVLNKVDLYSPEQRQRLMDVLQKERLTELVPDDQVVMTSADPREKEYVIEAADGSSRSEWRKPEPDVETLKVRILEILEREGLALVALNAAMYAADKSDRLASVRVQLRQRQATRTIWSFATVKATTVGVNVIPVVDVLTGSAIDVSMVVTLARIYGLEMSWNHARKLVTTILKSTGWVGLMSFGSAWAGSAFKALTGGLGTVLTAVPQGAAAGYGSYIVGQAARHYFEHGASWGAAGPKAAVQQILGDTDRDSVLERLRDEIRNNLRKNPHSDGQSDSTSEA